MSLVLPGKKSPSADIFQFCVVIQLIWLKAKIYKIKFFRSKSVKV